MSLNNLDNILKKLENRPEWEAHQQHRQLLDSWHQIIDPKIAPYTRPLYLRQGVLWVATASAVWANHLCLQRYPLLQQLKTRLSQPINDIRFSSAQWYQSNGDKTQSSVTFHPCVIPYPSSPSSPTSPDNLQNPAQQALQRWLTVIRARENHLPPCPHCDCPTPPAELERWSVCASCASQSWRSPSFDSCQSSK